MLVLQSFRNDFELCKFSTIYIVSFYQHTTLADGRFVKQVKSDVKRLSTCIGYNIMITYNSL